MRHVQRYTLLCLHWQRSLVTFGHEPECGNNQQNHVHKFSERHVTTAIFHMISFFDGLTVSCHVKHGSLIYDGWSPGWFSVVKCLALTFSDSFIGMCFATDISYRTFLPGVVKIVTCCSSGLHVFFQLSSYRLSYVSEHAYSLGLKSVHEWC